MSVRVLTSLLAATLALLTLGCASPPEAAPGAFSIAMIPDTQNYVDYTHQRDAGFAFDASALFIEQMRWLSQQRPEDGGNLVFVAAVGDVWQHQSKAGDPAHEARGIHRVDNPIFQDHFAPTPKVHSVEMPAAAAGYRLLHEAGIPFGVAPGNHDYDSMWTAASHPPNLSKPRDEITMADVGVLHVGGLDNFRSVFGAQTDFFRDQPWYVASFRGGANSAQRFHAGGYDFLHVAIEMQADDEVIAWVESVLAAHPGLPTIVSTHDYLSGEGERVANAVIDLDRVDPDHHNSAEELWQKLLAPNDQIFMLLCGHQHGQALRVDRNEAGHEVYQILADYQDRGQAGIDAGQPLDPFLGGPVGIGDGWLRLLEFHLAGGAPRVEVRTWSTHYEVLSSDLATYAAWYRAHEQPKMTDAEFLAADAYEIPLPDFRARFGAPAQRAK